MRKLYRVKLLTPEDMQNKKIFRLKELLDEKKVTMYQIERDIGIRFEVLRGMRDNTSNSISRKTMVLLSTYLGVQINELFEGGTKE